MLVYDTLYTLSAFADMATSGQLVDDDGYGRFTNRYKLSDTVVRPSEVKAGNCEIEEWVTHVAWVCHIPTIERT